MSSKKKSAGSTAGVKKRRQEWLGTEREIAGNRLRTRVQAELGTLLNMYRRIVQAAQLDNTPAAPDESLAAAQSLDLKVFASNVARASENLLGVAAELKELLVLSDFERLEAADRQNRQALKRSMAEARRGLESADQRLQGHIRRLETVLAAVPVLPLADSKGP